MYWECFNLNVFQSAYFYKNNCITSTYNFYSNYEDSIFLSFLNMNFIHG